MKSMTGYGKAVCELPDKKISIEIKSVNSKQLDLNIKLPAVLRDKEPEIRSFISKKLERGKIDLYINIEYLFAHGNFSLNTPQAIKYLEDIKQLSAELGLELPQEIVPLLVRLPDVVKTPMDEVNENEWVKIFESFEKAVDNLVTFRKNEGNVMKKDIEQHVLLILQGLPQIKTFEKNRINQIKQRIQTNLESVFPQEKIDANRFEQEVIY
ncbi:MAG: hypothetical protein PHR81_05635, partial [Bacteroidales bacterium]|nr:hypothetical protein [Bacteroidales bacterium]